MEQDYDPQAEKVYDWEDEFILWPGAHLSEKQCKKLIYAACKKYRVKPPKVRFYKTNAGPSSYFPSDHIIQLRPRHRNAAVCLHESAHCICDTILGDNLSPHGPEFVGIYMVLLEEYDISSRVALHASAKNHGITYRLSNLVSPSNIRKRYKRRK